MRLCLDFDRVQAWTEPLAYKEVKVIDKKYGLLVVSWKPKAKPVREKPLSWESFGDLGRPYHKYAKAGHMRPATMDEYIDWCRLHWPKREDGGERKSYRDQKFNDPSRGYVDLWYMVEPFRVPKSYGADSFDIIIPKRQWMKTCVPTKPNPYMKYEQYPDIGHNTVYGPDGTTDKWRLIKAYDHPWFHKRYPLTVEQFMAEERTRDAHEDLCCSSYDCEYC